MEKGKEETESTDDSENRHEGISTRFSCADRFPDLPWDRTAGNAESCKSIYP